MVDGTYDILGEYAESYDGGKAWSVPESWKMFYYEHRVMDGMWTAKLKRIDDSNEA